MTKSEISKPISVKVNGTTYHGTQTITSKGQVISCRLGSEPDYNQYETPEERDAMAEVILSNIVTTRLQKTPKQD